MKDNDDEKNVLDSKKDKTVKKEPKAKKEKSNKTSWLNGYATSVREEFSSRIGSSWKRVIKFLGICIVPILYGVTCILAFWNPIPNIGKASVTFLDQEQEMLVATSFKMDDQLDGLLVYKNDSEQAEKPEYKFITTLYEKNQDGNYSEASYRYNDEKARVEAATKVGTWMKQVEGAKDLFKTSAELKNPVEGVEVNYLSDIRYVYDMTPMHLLQAFGVITSNDSSKDIEDQKFQTKGIGEENIAFSNIDYKRWDNGGSDIWQTTKSYVQIKVEKETFSNLINFANYFMISLENQFEESFGAMLPLMFSLLGVSSIDEIIAMPQEELQTKLEKLLSSPLVAAQLAPAKEKAEEIIFSLTGDVKTQLEKLKETPLNIWTTYSKNFLFGYYLNTVNKFKDAIPMQILEGAPGIIQAYLNQTGKGNINLILEGIGAYDSSITTTSDLVKVDVHGQENGIYGIGLGQFFLLIGLFVGTLMHTFVYDRAKRGGPKVSKTQWYCAKWTLMIVTGFIQTTLLVLAAAAAGMHQLGFASLAELWAVLLLVDLVFVTTIQAIWFSVKDETIGKFLVIIYMILNLSSGWGTFPSFMQFGFFHAVSYITEYSYSLHLMGLAIYGGNGVTDALFALQNVFILLAFAVVFFTFGILMSRFRNYEMHFGTYNKKHIAEGLQAIGAKEYDQFVTVNAKGRKTYNMKALDHEKVYEDLISWMRVNHPYEGQFKRYKEKQRPQVLKPNYSDDDIMTRNDDTLV